ncbi:MAG TPA: hypothetical protein VF692_00075 [Pyrinomonadaceae bacterium]
MIEPQLAGAAKKFIRPDEIVWSVIGDLRKIETSVRELNFGEIVKLNTDGEPIQ